MRRGTMALVLATLLAAPAALVAESLLRWLFLPPEFEELRGWLEPTLTPVAWFLVLLSALAGAAGLVAQRRLVTRKLARLDGATPAQRALVRDQVFLITASIPQLPTILSTIAFMLGASLGPTLVGMGICSISVLAQGLALRASEDV